MYTSPTYLGTITRDSDGKVVAPVSDESDPDFRAWVAWCEAGNQPTVDDDRGPVVPPTVTPCQFRLALNKTGLRAQVEAAVNAADQDTQDLWHYGSVIERGNPQLNAMATQLGITQAQVDQLFILAETLV